MGGHRANGPAPDTEVVLHVGFIFPPDDSEARTHEYAGCLSTWRKLRGHLPRPVRATAQAVSPDARGGTRPQVGADHRRAARRVPRGIACHFRGLLALVD